MVKPLMPELPFHLMITLRTPVISSGQLTLDAILTAALFRETRDIDAALSALPLLSSDAIWHGSSAFFEAPLSFLDIPYIQQLSGEQDWSLDNFYVARKRNNSEIKILKTGGAYVPRLDRHKACVTRRVHYFGCGRGPQVQTLIENHLPGLGSNTNHGFGEIESVQWRTMTADLALIHRDGLPLRPVPVTFWNLLPQRPALSELIVNEESWRPPYRDEANRVLCVIPDTRSIDLATLRRWLSPDRVVTG
jgi:hypothetical protein